jgi:hypothetical protein
MRKRLLAIVGAVTLLASVVGPTVGAAPDDAQGPNFFQIFFKTFDAPQTRLDTLSFDIPPWQFGDRAGYRCAWAFLMDGGVPVARVQFDRGQTYAGVIDKFGQESNNDMSQCKSSEELEVKPKASGLADTVVDFNVGGGTLASMTFPATTGEDSESWWELEEAHDDEVEIELYWKSDVAIIGTITSLSPTATFSVRSTGAPRVNSVSPMQGGPGTQVTITGANFVGVNSVTFGGVSASFESESAGEIVATVPDGAVNGPVAVTSVAGTGTSDETFTVSDVVTHASKVSLKLSGKLVASRTVGSLDGTASCKADRTVVAQKRVDGKWRNRGKDQTDDSGNYRVKMKNKSGLYRARVKKKTLANGEICLRDLSGAKRSG